MGLLGSLTGQVTKKLPGMGDSKSGGGLFGKTGLLGKASAKIPMPGRKTGKNGVSASPDSSAAYSEDSPYYQR
jgi:hypothetical protein